MSNSPPSRVAVACSGITKAFGTGNARMSVLRDLDLTIPMGELTLLVGPSGCGKSTLISIITGILNPDAGSVEVFGQDLSRMSTDVRTVFRRDHIGIVFQRFNLLPALTAAENTAVPLVIAGRSMQHSLRTARTLLERLELDDRADALPAELSSGQQQRVAIARALIHEPQLVVCDEPTSSIDHRTGRSVMELLQEVAADDGRGVLVVTHDPRVLQFGHRIAQMDDGRIATTDNVPKEAMSIAPQ